MGKENIPQLTGKKHDLNLNFLPMQMKLHSESRKHHGLFMIIGICRGLASGEPLWYLTSILAQAQSSILFPCRAFMMKLKILICDHHTTDQSKHMDFVLCFIWRTWIRDVYFIFCSRPHRCFSNFKVQKNPLGSLLKCRFGSKQNESFVKEVRLVVIFAGVVNRRGMREICGICEMQYMCKMYWTLRLGIVCLTSVLFYSYYF